MEINAERVKEALKEGNIVIVAGFQGMTDDGDITFLQSLFDSFGVNFQNSAFVICLARYNTGLSPRNRYP